MRKLFLNGTKNIVKTMLKLDADIDNKIVVRDKTHLIDEILKIIKSNPNSTELDLTNLDVSEVDNFSELFNIIYQVRDNIKKIDISEWDMSKSTRYDYMFAFSKKLTEVDMSGILFSDNANMEGMFKSCPVLKYVIVDWDNVKPKKMKYMFEYCFLLENVSNIGDLDVTDVESFDHMFANCYPLKKLDLSKWNTKSSCFVQTFISCENLKKLKLPRNIGKLNLANFSGVPTITKVKYV